MPKTLALLFLLCLSALGVEIRVASFNVGALYLSGGPVHGLGETGSPGYEATKAIVGRIDADVIALLEIHNADLEEDSPGALSDLHTLAADLGYSHIYIPPRTSLDFTFRNVVLSKFPFLSQTSVGSPPNSNEVSRRFPVVKVDVPGTGNDPLIIVSHLKSGTTLADRFRRTIEMRRLNDHFVANQISPDSNFVIVGDFNLSSTNRTFTEMPGGIPASFVLGADVSYPVTYSTSATTYFSPTIPTKLDLRQANGSTATHEAGSAIDLILVSPAFAGRPVSSEIYNSALDASNNVGLPKSGPPLPADTSDIASDHYAVFADLELDLDFPNLHLALSAPSVPEKAPSGSVKLIISIPAPHATNLTVQLSSDNPSIAYPLSTTATIPAGALSATVDIATLPNFTDDDGTTVSFVASATNYDPDTAILKVANEEGAYTFTARNQAILETFTLFDGTHDPAPWRSPEDLPWWGFDTGSSAVPGFRSYGNASNPSLGFLQDPSDTSPTSIQATFRNLSPETLESLAISFTARQWRAVQNGMADQLKASIITSNKIHQIPSLKFTPSTALPTGPLSPPLETFVTGTVDGLTVPPGGSFDLRFTASSGSGGGTLANDVFISEFHYDNTNEDIDEFVEIIVAPGFSGDLADVQLVLYNGDNTAAAVPYGTHPLDTFTLGATTPSGHRVFHKWIPGIQNGPRDGFAVVHGTDLLHFISYEGTFTAALGPAAGFTSIATNISQTTPQPPGVHSVRLIGSGSSAADFTWAKTNIPHSPGVLNEGMTLRSPIQSQGFSIDDIAVTFLPPDVDSDGDGFTDRIEQNLLLTDPFNPASTFAPTLSPVSPYESRLHFPTLSGRGYLIQTSIDLSEWSDHATLSGNGTSQGVNIPHTATKRFFRVIIRYE